MKDELKEKYNLVKEVNVFNSDFTTLIAELDSLKSNIVFSPVGEQVFVSSLLSSLESKRVYCNIATIGRYEWTTYKRIELSYFFDMQLTFHTPFYIDYENHNVKEFLKIYRLFFGSEPVRNSKYGFNYSMLGYDVANFFITGYAMFGNNMSENAPCLVNNAAIFPFKFRKLENGGCINTYLQQVNYVKEGYNIDRVEAKKP